MDTQKYVRLCRATWNKGKLIGQKAPLKLKDIWGIRIRLQLARRTRDMALLHYDLDGNTFLQAVSNSFWSGPLAASLADGTSASGRVLSVHRPEAVM